MNNSTKTVDYKKVLKLMPSFTRIFSREDERNHPIVLHYGSYFWEEAENVIGETFVSLVDYNTGINLLCKKGFFNDFKKKALLTNIDMDFYKQCANELCTEDILLLFSMKGIDINNPIYRKFHRDLGYALDAYNELIC